VPLPLIASALLGAGRAAVASRVGGALLSGGGAAARAGSVLARSEALGALRTAAIEKGPRALFNMAGGNRIPLLDSAFGSFDTRRLKKREDAQRESDSDVKKSDSKRERENDKRDQKQDAAERTRQRSEDAKEAGEENARRQEKAHQAGIAVLEKNRTSVLQQIADDISNIKGLLGGQRSSGGQTGESGSGGGFLSTLLTGALFMPSLLKSGKGVLGKALSGAKGLVSGAGRLVGGVVPGLSKVATAGSGIAKTAASAGKSIVPRALLAAGVGTAATALGAEAAESAAKNVAVKAGVGVAGKSLGGLAGKAIGKSILKKIPIVGLLAGLGFAAYRAAKGDWAGAGMEVASGAASTIPGIGTAASVGIDLALAKRDYDAEVAPVDAAAGDFSSVESGVSTSMQEAAAKSPEATPFERLSATLASMYALMSDEKQGVFVRQANDSLRKNFNLDPSLRTVKTSNDDFSDVNSGAESSAGKANFTRNRGDSKLTSDQKDMAFSIYESARRNGFSDAGARVLVSEIGRENSLNPDVMFGTHTDASNNQTNAGLISFQQNRKDALMKYLSGVPGALDESGNMTRGQVNLDAQMAFIRKEMSQGKTKDLVQMLSSENFDQDEAHDRLGRDYIKWRIDDPAYRDAGISNRNTFRQGIDSILGPSAGSISPEMDSSSLLMQTQAAIDQGVKYGFGSKDTRSGKIDCSGWVAQINRGLISDISERGEEMAGSKKAEKLFEGGAAGIVDNIAKVTGKVLSNNELTADSLKEGMIIGEDNGEKGWDAGRARGVDHITQVVKDPTTGKMMISQSSSGKGVSLMPAEEYLQKKNAKGTKLYGVDTNEALNQITAGEWNDRSKSLQQDGTRYADAMLESKAELAQASNVQAAPTVIVAPGGSTSSSVPAVGGAGLKAPLVTRNSDASIRRLTDNHMSKSMAIS